MSTICDNISYDNRESCVALVPSSCIPYTGYVSNNIIPWLPCRPNINDLLKRLQILVDDTKRELGDNTTLDKACLTFTPSTVTQVQLNQLFINQICAILTAIAGIHVTIDPHTFMISIDLNCLQDPGCPPTSSYSLYDILLKLITAYCNLETRVTAIETLLNI